MQNIAIDIEVNLEIRKEKLKAEGEKNNIAEGKLDILVSKIEEMI